MADENNKTGTIKQPENPMVFEIERNGVVMTFTEQVTTRGQDPGKMIFEPSCNKEAGFLIWVGVNPEIATALSALGDKVYSTLSNVAGIVRGKVRTLSQGWAKEALDQATDEDTNVLDRGQFENIFKKFASEFSASGEKIGDLEDQRDELNEALVQFNLNDASRQGELLELMKKLQDINITINSKRKERKVKKAEAAAVPA